MMMMRNLCEKPASRWPLSLALAVCSQLLFITPGYADFINGGLESPYTPNSSTCSPITGWTQTGYYFSGTGSSNPASIDDINLQSVGGTGIQFCGVTDILSGATQTIFDYFLFGATPTPTLLVPALGNQSALINLRSIDAPLTKVGTSNPVTGWTNIASQATSLSQQMTVQSTDIDSVDGKVHVRFIAAPVLQNPAHTANQQPFIAIQLNNITTGRTGSSPLFFQWGYGGQAGVPWQSLTGAGTNSGSTSSYQYTNLQAFDISPGNAFVHVGDVIELVALASGCSPGGHDGHLYLDQVHTNLPPVLWVSATGPASSTPGNDVTYTYSYINNSAAAVDNVQVVVALPQQQNGTNQSTTFVSVTTPTAGTSPSCSGTGPVTCSLGTLHPAQLGTFQLTVNVPSSWALATGPVSNGNYPISGTGVTSLLGPLVQTNLLAPSGLSNLIVDSSGLPSTATIGQAYSGTFSCSNSPTASATGSASNASCEIVNLPAGLTQTGCTVSPSNSPWTQPSSIPSAQTVTCSVSGTPTTASTAPALAETNADNNSNSTANHVNATVNVVSSTNHTAASGSGTFSSSGHQISFRLKAGYNSAHQIVASMSYRDPSTGVHFDNPVVTTLTFSGNQITMGGTVRVLGGSSPGPATFTITLVANASPATNDTISVSLSNGYSASGNLTSGEISSQ